MNEVKQRVEEYLKRTGQTRQELMSGGETYGFDFIVNTLVPQALEQNKKIIWTAEVGKGLGTVSYSFQDL